MHTFYSQVFIEVKDPEAVLYAVCVQYVFAKVQYAPKQHQKW